MFRKLCFTAFLFFFITDVSVSQTTLQGTVTEASSGKPLTGVNVYLAGTTFGESTDQDGNYEFTARGSRKYNIVFSFVGYNKQIRSIELSSSNIITTNVELKQKVENLNEIDVVASNKKWKRQFDIFFDQFIGKTKYAEEVTIKNPWVLTFEEQDNKLIATAKRPLKIVNEALGYRIYAELITFKWPKYQDRGGSYKILPKYEPLSAETKTQRHQWKKNRLKNYLGSFTHFLNSLYHDELKQNNFSVKRPGYLSTLSEGKTKYRLLSTRGASPSGLRGYKLSRKIEIDYEHTFEYQFDGWFHTISVEKHGAVSPNTQDNYFYVNENGGLLDPASLKVYQNWADERVANSLPTDYTAK